MPPSAAVRHKKREERPRPKPEPLRGRSGPLCAALMGESHDVERNARLPELLGEVLLNARAFADDGFDRLQAEDAVVADERGAVALAAIEPELDDLDAARGGPCVRDGIAALGLRGRGEDHLRDASLDGVEAGPEKVDKGKEAAGRSTAVAVAGSVYSTPFL